MIQTVVTSPTSSFLKNYDASSESRFIPRFPLGFVCPPITSLYGSWIDIDGSRRDGVHTGIDLGNFGDMIVAPAPGRVVRVWRANWGCGFDGALLLIHSREDLGLSEGPKFYYTEYDHLGLKDRMLSSLAPGQRVARGQPLAQVSRPGNDSDYLPELHWELWELDTDAEEKITWSVNEDGGETWYDHTEAQVIDPLWSFSLNGPLEALASGKYAAPVVPVQGVAEGFRGLTYPLVCGGCSTRS